MLIGDPLGEGSNASSTDSELWRVENSYLRMRGSSDTQKGDCAIAGYRLLHRGHPLIAIFTHPFNVSITSMLKTMNTRKIAFSTPSQPPHGDLGRKEGSLELGVYGQKDYFMFHNLQ